MSQFSFLDANDLYGGAFSPGESGGAAAAERPTIAAGYPSVAQHQPFAPPQQKAATAAPVVQQEGGSSAAIPSEENPAQSPADCATAVRNLLLLLESLNSRMQAGEERVAASERRITQKIEEARRRPATPWALIICLAILFLLLILALRNRTPRLPSPGVPLLMQSPQVVSQAVPPPMVLAGSPTPPVTFMV